MAKRNMERDCPGTVLKIKPKSWNEKTNFLEEHKVLNMKI